MSWVKKDDNLHYEKFQDGTVKCIEDEIPFEVPERWEWARVSFLSAIVTDGEHKTPKRCNNYEGYYLLSARNIQDGYIVLDNVDYVDQEEFLKISKRCYPKRNDILISCSGSIGRVTAISDDNYYVMVRSVAMVRFIEIIPLFAMFALQSPYLQSQMQKYSKQTAQANLFQAAISNLLMPVPPLIEQSNIVKQLYELLERNKLIENNIVEIGNLISKIKSKILDLAIHGQLVPQNQNDEPASVLLERIRAEKEELIKQGKIKRDKNESIIYKGDDNSYYEKFSDGTVINIQSKLPFDIPNSWEWTNLSFLALKEIKRGKTPRYVEKSNILVFAQKCNLKKGGIDYGLSQYLDETILLKYDKAEYLHRGDIVINSTGTGTLGRVGYINTESDLPIVTDSHITTIRVTTYIRSDYVYIFLKAVQPLLENSGEGSTNQKELKPYTLKNIIVPVPPLEEQIRISQCVFRSNKFISHIESSLS